MEDGSPPKGMAMCSVAHLGMWPSVSQKPEFRRWERVLPLPLGLAILGVGFEEGRGRKTAATRR